MGGRKRTPAGALALTMAVACGGVATSTESSAPASPSNTSTVQILRHVRTAPGPIGITAAFGSIWVVNSEFREHDRGSVMRLDPTNGTVLATVHVGGVPLEVTAAAGSVWVSNSDDASVSRVE